jgi:hypothetical protein
MMVRVSNLDGRWVVDFVAGSLKPTPYHGQTYLYISHCAHERRDTFGVSARLMPSNTRATQAHYVAQQYGYSVLFRKMLFFFCCPVASKGDRECTRKMWREWP